MDFYNQALPIRRAVGDRAGEAATLNTIGSVYHSLGETQKALDFYNQALPIRRAVGDRAGEAETLNTIASVYDSIGEEQKALDYLSQALSIDHGIGGRWGKPEHCSISASFIPHWEKRKRRWISTTRPCQLHVPSATGTGKA